MIEVMVIGGGLGWIVRRARIQWEAIQDGKLIGAIGVSGAKPSEDGQVARAGLAALVDGPKQ